MLEKILFIVGGVLLGTAAYYILVYILDYTLGQTDLVAKTQLHYLYEEIETLRKDYTLVMDKVEKFREALGITKEDKVDENTLKKLTDDPVLRNQALNLTVDIVGACSRIVENAHRFELKDNNELIDSVESMSGMYRHILTYIAYLEYKDMEPLSEGDLEW